MTLHPVILAGGVGTRLWPLSRLHFPKQFQPLMGDRTLFQETVLRLAGLSGAPPLVVCNHEHRFIAMEQLEAVGTEVWAAVLEPVPRNTAPALTLAALALMDRATPDDPEPVFIAMPADHLIQDQEGLGAAIRQAAALAGAGYLVTLGVVPTAPNTGYGYIKKGSEIGEGQVESELGPAKSAGQAPDGAWQASPPLRVAGFVEKPDAKQAQKYVDSGEYLWNSGIFLMRASVWLHELELCSPDISEMCRRAYAGASWDGVFLRPDTRLFEECPSDSIDYAVMERAAKRLASAPAEGPSGGLAIGCAVVPLDAGWSDVGSWSTLWDRGDQDPHGNVVRGDVQLLSVRNSLVFSQGRLVTALGLDNVVIVDTPDALLVADKSQVESVKELVATLKAQGRPEQEYHRKVHRPWGSYEVLDERPAVKVKRLLVNPGAAISLQKHHHRAEHWVVVKGVAQVTRGEESMTLHEFESVNVPVGVVHRLENLGSEPLEVIEVQAGTYLGEDDIVRLEDHWGRQET